MSKIKILFSGLFLAILIAGNAYSKNSNNVSVLFVPLVSNISSEYKLAAVQFLPDVQDSEFKFGGGHNRNDCSSYTLSACPANGYCSKCPIARKYKLNSCKNGYAASADRKSCIDTVFCRETSTTFKNIIPSNYVCAKVVRHPNSNVSDICYQNCAKISCSNYLLDCRTINKTALHIAETEICPSCKSSINSNCTKDYCKITKCMNGYKIANNGTVCIALDDTCPEGYYKTCETGTQGTPQYTEKGTACYQCKPKALTCKDKGMIDIEACHISGSTNYGPIKAWTPANMGL